MANTFLNTGRTVRATSNPQANVEQIQPVNAQTQTNPVQPVQNNNVAQTNNNNTQNTNNAINPITIPIQIQPTVSTQSVQTQTQTVQPNQNVQVQEANNSTGPTPQAYQPQNTNNNVIDFDQIYSSYQSAYGNNNNSNNNTSASGIKKTSLGTTIVTPTASNLNSVEGMYQSSYANTINSLLSEMITQLETGFQYDPSKDSALKVASEYAANTTMQSLAGSGVLNSSATAERVARVVSELVPQYEQLAYTRWTDYIGQLSDTAQLVMNYDSQQFEYWKDAKDREFQNKQFEYQKQQDALENAWKRVDELGYVDNEASTILGVPVGTLSGEARLAKEQQEFELAKMREQAEIEYENNKALYQLRAELDKEQARYTAELQKEQAKYESELNKDTFKVVTQTKPTTEQIEDAVFAWKIAKYAKTHSVVIAKDFKTSAIAQGHLNPIIAVEEALNIACDSSKEAVMALDSTIAAIDCINAAAQGRISLIIHSGGSPKDAELIKLADKFKIAIISTGIKNTRN